MANYPVKVSSNTLSVPGDNPVIRKMLKRFTASEAAERDNRERGLNALRFRTGGKHQWSEQAWTTRGEFNQPRESYNQIPQFVHQVTNDMRMNMPQTRFVPGNDGTKEAAEIYEDLARAIQSESDAEVAYDTAADSQVTIGWGYWRYITEYESDKGFDQIIKIFWVPNPFTVYDDPDCLQQDRLDRKFLIQVCDRRVGDFNAANNKNYTSVELSSIGDNQPGWATADIVREVEYWEVVETKTKLKQGDKERDVVKKKVIWRRCTALEVLEEKEWDGIYIPYVRVAGEEINIDGNWQCSGLVEAMISPQRQYNYWMNGATEMVSLAPRQPYLVDPEQIEGYEPTWDQMNIKNYPYLPYRTYGRDNKQYQPPSRQQVGTDIAAMASLISMADQNFYKVTGIYPASLGQVSNEKSGKAILARQKEGDVSTFHYTDNLARALRAGGRILEDLIKKIYDGSRSVRVTKEDKSERLVKINQEYVDDETKQTKNYDLTVGTYDVVVTTGPSFTTKRAEASEAMIQLAQSMPDALMPSVDILLSNQDWPGAEEMAARTKFLIEQKFPGITQSGDGEQQGVPPQVVEGIKQQAQQAIQALGQQLQQAQQELQQLQMQAKDKQADYQLKGADLQLKQQEMMSKAQIDQLNAENQRAELAIKAKQLEIDEAELSLKREESSWKHCA